MKHLFKHFLYINTIVVGTVMDVETEGTSNGWFDAKIKIHTPYKNSLPLIIYSSNQTVGYDKVVSNVKPGDTIIAECSMGTAGNNVKLILKTLRVGKLTDFKDVMNKQSFEQDVESEDIPE